MKRLRVGVVGAGVGRAHVEAYLALPEQYEVAALCDIDPTRREEVAEAAAIPERAGRLEDLFGLDLDIIDICTPSALHFEQATAVLETGIHAVIEKPVTRSLADLDALARTEALSGKRACPVFQYRFGHGIQKLHHLIAKGVAGRPSAATAHDPWTFPNDDPEAAAAIEDALTDFEPLPERFTGQFFRLHAALTGDAPLPVDLSDARRSIELLAAAYWSARTGENVPLPIGADHPFHAGWLETMKKETAHG